MDYEEIIKDLYEEVDRGKFFTTNRDVSEKFVDAGKNMDLSQIIYLTTMCNFEKIPINMKSSIDNILFEQNVQSLILKTLFTHTNFFSKATSLENFLVGIVQYQSNDDSTFGSIAKTKVFFSRSDIEYFIKLFINEKCNKYWKAKYMSVESILQQSVETDLQRLNDSINAKENDINSLERKNEHYVTLNDKMEEDTIFRKNNIDAIELEYQDIVKRCESLSKEIELIQRYVQEKEKYLELINDTARKAGLLTSENLSYLSTAVKDKRLIYRVQSFPETFQNSIKDYNKIVERRNNTMLKNKYLKSFEDISRTQVETDMPELDAILTAIKNNNILYFVVKDYRHPTLNRMKKDMLELDYSLAEESFSKASSKFAETEEYVPDKPYYLPADFRDATIMQPMEADDQGATLCNLRGGKVDTTFDPNVVYFAINNLFDFTHVSYSEIKKNPLVLSWRDLKIESNLFNLVYLLR